MVQFASAFLSVLVFACAFQVDAAPLAGGHGGQNAGKGVKATASAGGCNAATRQMLKKAQNTNKALQQVASAAQNDTALIASITSAEDALTGIANVTAALGAGATPNQDDLNLITTSLGDAKVALDGAQVPADTVVAGLLQKAQKSLNQTAAAGTRVAKKCGGAAASVTASDSASATDASSATISDSASVTESAPARVTDVAESSLATACPAPVTVTVTAGGAAETAPGTISASSTTSTSVTASGSASDSGSASATATASVTSTTAADPTATGAGTDSPGTPDDLPKLGRRSLRPIFMVHRAL